MRSVTRGGAFPSNPAGKRKTPPASKLFQSRWIEFLQADSSSSPSSFVVGQDRFFRELPIKCGQADSEQAGSFFFVSSRLGQGSVQIGEFLFPQKIFQRLNRARGRVDLRRLERRAGRSLQRINQLR